MSTEDKLNPKIWEKVIQKYTKPNKQVIILFKLVIE